MHLLVKITFEAEPFTFTSFYSISDCVTLQVTLFCHTTVVLFPVYARKNFWEGTNLAANLALFSNPALQMQYFQWGVQGWINFLIKKKKWALHMCNSVNNTYKKHLPVYIYIHSSLIEPVEITALQIKIIIIIDPSEIHSPRLNILIYIRFKNNQTRDTSFGPKYVHIIFAVNTSFAGKLLWFFRIKEPHFNLFLPITSLFLNFIYSSNYLCQTKNRYKTPTTSLKVRPGNHKIFKCSAMELIESTKPGLAIPRNQSSKLYCMIFLQTTFTHLLFLKQFMQSLE